MSAASIRESRPARLRELFATLLACLALVLGAAAAVQAADAPVSAFVGEYSGSAEMVAADGTRQNRDMSVRITETKSGFIVDWTSVTYKPDGRTKEKSYSIEFQPSDRDGVYSAAMKRNVFGHTVQLDPMKGEPYVWGRISGDTMTVYSLFIDAAGDYEVQQFDRTLADGGLELLFTSNRQGTDNALRTVSSFLKRE